MLLLLLLFVFFLSVNHLGINVFSEVTLAATALDLLWTARL